MDCKYHRPYKLARRCVGRRRLGQRTGAAAAAASSASAHMQATCKHSGRDVSSRPPACPNEPSASSHPASSSQRLWHLAHACIPRRTAGDRAARARTQVVQGHLFFAYVGEVKSRRATERAGDVARGWSIPRCLAWLREKRTGIWPAEFERRGLVPITPPTPTCFWLSLEEDRVRVRVALPPPPMTV